MDIEISGVARTADKGVVQQDTERSEKR